MTKQDHLDRVWDIIERVGVCVLTTRFAGGLRARPVEARPDRTAGIIWFVTDVRSSKEPVPLTRDYIARSEHGLVRSNSEYRQARSG
jgi:hypothetical protein